MDRNKLNTYISDILSNVGDQGKISEILNSILSENDKTEKNLLDLTKSNETLTKYNESLVKVNNNIMVQLGEQLTNEEITNTEESKKDENVDEYANIKDLDELIKEGI